MLFFSEVLSLFLTETWELYGDAVWWSLCTSFDVAVFNLLWLDLQ